jgi:2-methylisocitrate lyase-like PEP mutase family enzyme
MVYSRDMKNSADLNDRARRLRALHDDVLVLPNAWDAASASVIARAGAAAIATSSAGVAWALGVPDGQQLTRDEMLAAVARVVRAVDVPVTADMERGYGDTPEEVAATVREVIAVGAVGINLEDSTGPRQPLLDRDEQAARIRAAVDAAAAAGVPDFVLNARTDVYLSKVGEPAERPGEVLARAEAYAAAGAGSIFVPGLLDLDVLRTVTSGTPLPVNVMAVPGGPSIPELRAAGARRISLGGFLMLGAYAATHQMAAEVLLEGTYKTFPDTSGVRSVLARYA